MKDFCFIAHFLMLVMILDVRCWKVLNEYSISFYRENQYNQILLKIWETGQQLVDLLMVSFVFLFINMIDIISLKCKVFSEYEEG